MTDDQLSTMVLNQSQAKILIHHNQELILELAKSEVTKEDIVALGYRKSQLERFENLLNDQSYFESECRQSECTAESLWQRFFEKNKWVFGYGLGYLFLTGLNDKKLEQVVQGYDLSKLGKRADAIMKTRGIIGSLCFIEIKTHKTELLQKKYYRSGCWAPSDEMVGAVSQVQGTVSRAVKSLSEHIEFEDKHGNPTGEQVFNYHPKSYLVIGTLAELITEHGINKERYRSFELYRRNTSAPEIITFDH